MSFSDTFKKSTEPHVDTPAQAKARTEAAAEVKARAEAKTAKNTCRAASGRHEGPDDEVKHGAPRPARARASSVIE